MTPCAAKFCTNSICQQVPAERKIVNTPISSFFLSIETYRAVSNFDRCRNTRFALLNVADHLLIVI